MAVVIYKDGESKLISPELLKNELDAGWSLDSNDSAMQDALADDNQDGEPDIIENERIIREKAKSCGVKSSHNKSLERLIEEIKELENADQD